MNTAIHYRLAGMGAPTTTTPTNAQLAQAGAAGATVAAAQIIRGNYVGGAGSVLLTASMVPGPQQIFLAVAGAAAELLGAIGIGKGCGNTCIEATAFANQAEPLLQQNLATYMAIPAPRTQSEQQAALNIFDQIWAGLTSVQACGNPALGSAGKACISDRQSGSCAYKDANGQCWNWFVGYRDPIANDPNVVPDTAASTVAGAVSSVIPGLNIDPTLLMVGLGLVVVFMVAS
jgi:hypothetical protein